MKQRADREGAARAGSAGGAAALRARVAAGARRAFGWQVAALGLGFLVHLALARWLGAAGYGVYAYVLAWTALLSVPSSLGLPLLIVRYVPEYTEGAEWGRLRGLVRWAWRVSAGAAFGAVVAAVPVAWVLVPEVYRLPLLAGLVLIPLNVGVRLAAGWLRAVHRVGRSYALAALRHAAVLALAAAGVLAGTLTAGTAVVLTAAAALLVLLGHIPLLRRTLPPAARQAPAVYEGRRWLRVAGPLLLVGGFVLLLGQTDVVVVGWMVGPDAAGPYRAAAHVASLVALVPVAVGAAADPAVVRLSARGDRRALQHLVSTAVRWAFLAALAVGAALAAGGGLVLRLYGPDFPAAQPMLAVLAAGEVVYAGVGVAAGLLNLTGHHRVGMTIFGAAALLNLGLNVGGVWLFGAFGAALATAVALGLASVALWYAARRRTGVDASIIYSLAVRPDGGVRPSDP